MDCSWLILSMSGGAVASCSITAVAASWRSALPIGRVMVVSFITMLLLFVRHRHTLLYIKRQCVLNPLSNGIKRSNIEKRAYHASDITSQAGEFTLPYIYIQPLYQRHITCFDTLYVLDILFFRRCKGKEFSRNNQTFLNKNLYFNHFLG